MRLTSWLMLLSFTAIVFVSGALLGAGLEKRRAAAVIAEDIERHALKVGGPVPVSIEGSWSGPLKVNIASDAKPAPKLRVNTQPERPPSDVGMLVLGDADGIARSILMDRNGYVRAIAHYRGTDGDLHELTEADLRPTAVGSLILECRDKDGLGMPCEAEK
jgi:hypothetical protein